MEAYLSFRYSFQIERSVIQQILQIVRKFASGDRRHVELHQQHPGASGRVCSLQYAVRVAFSGNRSVPVLPSDLDCWLDPLASCCLVNHRICAHMGYLGCQRTAAVACQD
jgi:hypothetical protein